MAAEEQAALAAEAAEAMWAAAEAAARVAYEAEAAEAAAAAAGAAVAAAQVAYEAEAAARKDYAQKLLELIRDAARAAGGARPRELRRGNPRRKVSSAQTLIRECQRLWEHYCERPGKTRLRAVAKHCEAMKASTAKSVKAERTRCMRSVRAEAKARGWKL